ncbi:unnamed protein product [Peronospora belbahrii]|uniref:Uncharacterized protein n=1 Tax=Peronospora belbahrii TaxID=622444 RepID=A0AAU9KLI4_9STRA|nr:unnamed protein product [Peronospora belbahrii]
MTSSGKPTKTDALLSLSPSNIQVTVSAASDDDSDTLSSGQDVVASDAPGRHFTALTRTASSLRSPSSIFRSSFVPDFVLDGPSWKAASRHAAPSCHLPQSTPQTNVVLQTHLFPSDLYSGARFSRFEIEEASRQRNGTTLLDWLKSKGRNPFSTAMRKQEQKEKDRETHAKAQHRESFSYDFFESRVNMQHDQDQTEGAIRSLNIARWFMTVLMGLGTALVACCVFCRILDIVIVNISVGFVSIASYCVAILWPVADGSGISEIKATLNGIKIHRVVRLKTLFCKALSQGKFSSFGVDTSWTKFKGFRNDKVKRDSISHGAAVGVAAAFGAPIGCVLFALEEGASF